MSISDVISIDVSYVNVSQRLLLLLYADLAEIDVKDIFYLLLLKLRLCHQLRKFLSFPQPTAPAPARYLLTGVPSFYYLTGAPTFREGKVKVKVSLTLT